MNEPKEKTVRKLQTLQGFWERGNPVIVRFHAEWCGPCRMIEPLWKELSEKYGEEMFFVNVDIDQAETLAVKYKVSSIPAFVIFQPLTGKVLTKFMGANEKQLKQRIVETVKAYRRKEEE